DLSSARVQVLRNVVTTVAGADDQYALAAPCFTIVVLAGMQNLAPEVAQTRDIGNIRNAADAGCHDDVSWTQLPLSAIRATQHDRPSLLGLVIGSTLELSCRPVVELHTFHVGFEPAGQLVFGN